MRLFTDLSAGYEPDVLQGLLRRKCKDIPRRYKRGGGDEVLLRHLAENTKERRANSGSHEEFSDILYRHLYSPGPVKTWAPLIGKNRLLNEICYRRHVWDLATTAMNISVDMQHSWVTQGRALKSVAAKDAAMVNKVYLVKPKLTCISF